MVGDHMRRSCVESFSFGFNSHHLQCATAGRAPSFCTSVTLHHNSPHRNHRTLPLLPTLGRLGASRSDQATQLSLRASSSKQRQAPRRYSRAPRDCRRRGNL